LKRRGEEWSEGTPWVYLYIFLRLAYGFARKSLLQRSAALTATLKCVRVTAMTLQWTSVQCVCVRVCVWQLKAPAAHAREPSCFLVYIYLSAQCATHEAYRDYGTSVTL